jgi:hypothetical protein
MAYQLYVMVWHTSCLQWYGIPPLCDNVSFWLCAMVWHTGCMWLYGVPAVCSGMAYLLYVIMCHTGCVQWCDIPAVCDGMAYDMVHCLYAIMCHTGCMWWYGILAMCDAVLYQLIFVRRIFSCKWGNNGRCNKNNIYGLTAVRLIFKKELKEYSFLCHVWVWSQCDQWIQWLDYRLDGWRAIINLLAGQTDFVVQNVQTSNGCPPSIVLSGSWGSFPCGVKQLVHETDHTPLSNAKVKLHRLYIYIYIYIGLLMLFV